MLHSREFIDPELQPRSIPAWLPQRREAMPRGEAAGQGLRGWVWLMDPLCAQPRGREVALGVPGVRREGVWCPLLGQGFKNTLDLGRNNP